MKTKVCVNHLLNNFGFTIHGFNPSDLNSQNTSYHLKYNVKKKSTTDKLNLIKS